MVAPGVRPMDGRNFMKCVLAMLLASPYREAQTPDQGRRSVGRLSRRPNLRRPARSGFDPLSYLLRRLNSCCSRSLNQWLASAVGHLSGY